MGWRVFSLYLVEKFAKDSPTVTCQVILAYSRCLIQYSIMLKLKLCFFPYNQINITNLTKTKSSSVTWDLISIQNVNYPTCVKSETPIISLSIVSHSVTCRNQITHSDRQAVLQDSQLNQASWPAPNFCTVYIYFISTMYTWCSSGWNWHSKYKILK